MKKNNNKPWASFLVILSGFFLFTSCNKELEQFAPIPTPTYPTGSGIAGAIAATPDDSLYSRLIVRSGLGPILNDNTKSYTMFIADNAGMRLFVSAASGGLIPPTAPDAVHSNFIATMLPVASAQGIVSYNTVGQKFPSASLPTNFPNYPLPTLIVLDPTQPFVRMSIFPDKGAPYSYVNNLPLTGVDKAASNGVIHHTYSIVAPPTALLKSMIAAEPTLSYFRAAIARADLLSVGLSRFDSLLNYGVTNMTVLAPNDAAFQTLIYGLVYIQVLTATGNAALAASQASLAVAAGPAFLMSNNVTTAQVQGIVAYHFLASLTSSTTTPYQPNIRAFSVNMPTTPTLVKTLVNNGLSTHPGIMAQATFTGPVATTIKFTGVGPLLTPTTPPFSGTPANVVSGDKHGVNGVFHIIDAVLLPQ